MIRAIIIDDEAKSRSSLRKKLADFCPQVSIIAEGENGKEGIDLIEKHDPQLIFLDIEMPKMNGFDMLNAMKPRNLQIVFTTAYDQYAIKAFKYAALDYLLKPVDVDELQAVVGRLHKLGEQDFNKQLDLLRQNSQLPKKQWNKLAIPTLEGILFFDIHDIVQLEANSNYTKIFFVNKTIIIASRTLKEFEDLLPTDIFFRIHHSNLVNMNYIKRYIKGDGGQIELLNGSFVDVSRRKKEDFLKAIGY